MKEKSLKKRGDPPPATRDELKDNVRSSDDQAKTLDMRDDDRTASDKGLAKGKFEEHIGRQLRSVYDDVLNQPIPNRFLELLEQLERPKPQEDVRR